MMQTGYAVQAYPGIIKATQADGTEISIRLHGDERGHYTTTADGYPLIFNEQTGNYEYASVVNNAIVSSGLAAADAQMRSAEAVAFLRGVDSEAFVKLCAEQRHQKAQTMNAARARRAQNHTTGLINNFPHMGVQHSPVILVEFSDKSFTTMSDPKQYYADALNKEGFTASNGANGSARDFFVASSDGKFQPTFDVYGPVKINYSQRAFGEGDNTYEPNLATIIREAVKQLDDSVDFKQYDHDGDGYIDNIYFFYAGYGEADSYKSNTIWPHSYSWDELVSYGYATKSLTVDGKKMGSYACSQEINGSTPSYPVGIGTITHEFGHVIGLPDLYDIYYGTTTFTPGEYDAMDGGSYNNNQNTPPTFSAYERGELGWLDYTVLEEGTDTVSLLPDVKDSNMAYVVPVEGTNGREFFVLENRQQKGWDEYIPGHGMLMWHIDIDTLAWEQNTVNTKGSHQRIDIVEADNRRTSGSVAADPFPGTSNVTRWTMKSWAGDTLRVLDNIEETDSLIYLMLGGLNIKLDTPVLTATDVEDSTVTLHWNLVNIANTYTLGVVKDGEELTSTDYTYTDSVTLEGLTPSTDYTFTLVASRGSYRSDTVSVSVRTEAVPFAKLRPTGIALSPLTNDSEPTGIHAAWEAMDEADDYLVTLYHYSYDTPSALTSYDFSGRDGGLPELWQKKGAYITSSNWSVETPSLRLSNSEHYLLMAQPAARIDSVSFWAVANSAAKGTLQVETCTDGNWTEIAAYDAGTAKLQTKDTYTLTFAAADSVRIRFERETGSVYLDDVVTRYHSLQRTAVEGYESVLTGGATYYDFTGLQTGETYAFTVCGKQGDRQSYRSEETALTLTSSSAGIHTPYIYNNVYAPTRYYDLQGRRLTEPRGFCIEVTAEGRRLIRK